MKCRLLFFAVVAILVFSGCSQHRIQTISSSEYSSDGSHLAPVLTDTVTFEQELVGHLAMPDSVQAEIREVAEKELVDWRDFEREVQDSFDSIYRSWYQYGNVRKRVHRGVGLGNSLVHLRDATAIDPTFVEAWAARGRLACEAGDIHKGLEYLDTARLAALATMFERHSYAPGEADIRARIFYFTQIGYEALDQQETWSVRLERGRGYLYCMTGITPSESEVAALGAILPQPG